MRYCTLTLGISIAAGIGVLVGVLLALGALAAACGDDGEELTLEEYFQRLDAIYDQAVARSEAQAEAVAGAPGQEDLSAEEVLAYYRAVYGGDRDIASDFLVALRDLDPPTEAADAHNQAVDAMEATLEDYEDFLEGTSDSPSPEEAAPLLDELHAAMGRNRDTCLTLQTIANENDVDVDLECE
jgi:hypothetical protein